MTKKWREFFPFGKKSGENFFFFEKMPASSTEKCHLVFAEPSLDERLPRLIQIYLTG